MHQLSTKRSATQLPLHHSNVNQQLKTVVPTGPYKGIVGTVYHIIFEEGHRDITTTTALSASHSRQGTALSSRGKQMESKRTQSRRGQGIHGIIRGYRVGLYGLAGFWLASSIGGGGQTGGEF